MNHPISLSVWMCDTRLVLGLLAVTALGAGCVSQHAYDTVRAQSDELARTVEAERNEIRDLDQRVTALQVSNRQLDAATTEARAAIQRELEQEAMWRRRADERLAALQTQVASLLNQNRVLARELAEAKQERVSLQAMVTQYKEEIAAAQALPPPSLSPLPPLPPAPASAPASVTTPPAPAAPPPSAAQPPALTPVKPTVPTRPAKNETAHADDSWTGMIKSWVSSLWEWIFG